MSDVYEPPPMDYEHLEPPPDFYMDDPWAGMPMDEDYAYDPGLDFDPFPPPDYDLFPIPDDYTPDDLRNMPDLPPLSQDGLQGFEEPEASQ